MMPSKEQEPRDPLIFYGWIVVLASFTMLITLAGVIYSFGIFFKSLASEFNWSRTATSGILSTYWVCHVIGAIPTGLLTDRFGPRWVLVLCNAMAATGLLLMNRSSSLWQVYLFYGVMVGFGFAGTFAVLSATTVRWFVYRRGLALGIVACGIGIGTMLVAPIVERLIYWFGWRGAYLVLGILSLLTMVLPSLLIHKEPSVLRQKPYRRLRLQPSSQDVVENEIFKEETKYGALVRNIFHSSHFWIVLAIFFLFFICMQMTMAHLFNYATDMGIPRPVATRFIGIAGGFSILGRLGIGAFSDRRGPQAAVLLCTSIAAGSYLLLIRANGLLVFYLFSGIFGLAYGGEIPMIPNIIGHYFGTQALGLVVGATMSAASLGGAIGPLLGGLVFDHTGDYSMAFILVSGLSIVMVVLAFMLPNSRT